MGSEQSTNKNSSVTPLSPNRQGSVSSETEIPYVSYTVNRPIGSGDGNTTHHKSLLHRKRTGFGSKRLVSQQQRLLNSAHNTLVTVNKCDENEQDQENDIEIAKLDEIPSFLPIMRTSLSSNGAVAVKDPEILERLDYRGFLALCQRYSDHLRFIAGVVSTEQSEIQRKIRQTEALSAAIVTHMNERRKTYAQYAEKLSKVTEMSRVVNKCHTLLNENLERIEVLNNILPKEERLEPFVWTTG